MKKRVYRIFSTYHVKGTKRYIDSQKKYELIRTFLFFFIPISLFAAGYIATGTKVNLLTVVAVVGLLPASKSLVGAIMFLRYKSMGKEFEDKISVTQHGLPELFDMVFTTYDKNFVVSHMVIAGNTICGFTEDANFREKEFNTHIQNVLNTDYHKNISIKIFKDIDKYTERLLQLQELETNSKVNVLGIMDTLRSVAI